MKKFLISILILIIVAVPVGITVYQKVVTPTGLNYKQYKQGLKVYHLLQDYEKGKIGEKEFQQRYYSYTQALCRIKGNDECWNLNELYRALNTYQQALDDRNYSSDSFVIVDGETIDLQKEDLKSSKETIEAILNIGKE